MTMTAIWVAYAHASSFTSSAMVVRPSRMAITIGLLLVVVFNRYNSYRGWVTELSFPTQKSYGVLIQFYNMINPAWIAYRSLAIIFFFIYKKGSFAWSDITSTVPVSSLLSTDPETGLAIVMYFTIATSTTSCRSPCRWRSCSTSPGTIPTAACATSAAASSSPAPSGRRFLPSRWSETMGTASHVGARTRATRTRSSRRRTRASPSPT